MMRPERLIAALNHALALPPAERDTFDLLLGHLDLLEDSINDMEQLPQVMQAKLPDLKKDLLSRLQPQSEDQRIHLASTIDTLLRERQPALSPENLRERYFEQWPLYHSTEGLVRDRLQAHYQLGWTPQLLQQHIRTHHRVNVGMNILAADLSHPLSSTKHNDILLRTLTTVGPYNPRFPTELDTATIQHLYPKVVSPVAISPAALADEMAYHAAYDLADLTRRLPATLTADLTERLATPEDVLPHRTLLSEIIHCTVKMREPSAIANLLSLFRMNLLPEQAATTDETLYNLGYRSKPLSRLNPFTDDYPQALDQLIQLLNLHASQHTDSHRYMLELLRDAQRQNTLTGLATQS